MGEDTRALTMWFYGNDDACTEGNHYDANGETWTLADKDAETKCMQGDSDYYMVTNAMKGAKITTYTNDACTEGEVEVVDADYGECIEGDSTVTSLEWRGDGINIIDYSNAPGCPEQDASVADFFLIGDKDECLDAGSGVYYMIGMTK